MGELNRAESISGEVELSRLSCTICTETAEDAYGQSVLAHPVSKIGLTAILDCGLPLYSCNTKSVVPIRRRLRQDCMLMCGGYSP